MSASIFAIVFSVIFAILYAFMGASADPPKSPVKREVFSRVRGPVIAPVIADIKPRVHTGPKLKPILRTETSPKKHKKSVRFSSVRFSSENGNITKEDAFTPIAMGKKSDGYE